MLALAPPIVVPRLGIGRSILYGSMLFAAGQLATAFAPTPATFVLAIFASAVGCACIPALVATIAEQGGPAERGAILGGVGSLTELCGALGNPGVPEFVDEMVGWGAGPRAVQFLILGGKARALIYGRSHVSTEDIQAIAKPALRHRIVVNFAAESDGVTADQVIERLIDCTPTKEDELTSDARFQKIFAS